MKAVILAAGMGTRLLSLTQLHPKCMVEVGGKPIMEHQLDSLRCAGVHKCALVVGHKAGAVRGHFGTNYRGIELSYIENHRYAETNNLYSLWMAKGELDDDLLLIEGDLVFDGSLLQELVGDQQPNVAVVDRYRQSMDGTVILANNGFAESMVLKVHQEPGFDYGPALKTVNIYKLSEETLAGSVIPEMDNYLTQNRTDQYYEAVFADLIGSGRLRLSLLPTGKNRWAEIDTLEDLSDAEKMFAANPAEVP